MIKKLLIGFIFLLGLVYILVPGPSSIKDFPALQDSLKSNEVGDTVQVPNLAAYFSQWKRKDITSFYRKSYQNKFWFGNFIPPISLNYPPENAYQYERDQLHVTFLEEYVYPLKGSIFVGGYEPSVEHDILHQPHTFLQDHIHIVDQQGQHYFNSKTTIRFYPDNFFVKLIVYFGIWFVIFGLTKVISNLGKVESQ